MAATWTRGRFNNEYVPGLFALAVGSYDYKRKESVLKDICTIKSSRKSYEEMAMRSTLGLLDNKDEGATIIYDVPIQGWKKRWSPTVRAKGVRLTEEGIQDNLYEFDRGGDFAQDIFKDLGESAAMVPDIELGLAFDNATATTYHTAGDGVAWASASHKRIDGSTVSNRATSASPTWAAVWSAIEAAENQYDDRQKPIQCKVEGIIAPTPMEKYLEEIFRSTDRWDTANRATNVIKETRGGIKRTYFRNWTDTDAWCLKLSGFRNGLIWFENWKTKFAKEGDFETGDMRCKVTRRDALEMGDFREFYWVIP